MENMYTFHSEAPKIEMIEKTFRKSHTNLKRLSQAFKVRKLYNF